MTKAQQLLILGGTGDALALAQLCSLHLPDLQIINSLAGRTRSPQPAPGTTHVGGFGGEQGLLNYLQSKQIDAVIDATHPFAAQISKHAANACARAGVARLQLHRTMWTAQADDHWLTVRDMHDAAHQLEAMPLESSQRVFLSTGRQELSTFAHLGKHWFLLRSVDPLPPLPTSMHYQNIVARGPFALDDELTLLKQHRIQLVISKNSGGEATYAKIAAARQLSLPVMMLQAPAKQAGPSANNVEAALAWLRKMSE